MLALSLLHFGPYRLDLANKQLWHATQVIKLKRKAFDVLCYLAERPDQFVPREDLFGAVWPETVVSPAVLTVCVRELRQALKDDARQPQYIETVHGQGYRFVGQVSVPPSADEVPSAGQDAQEAQEAQKASALEPSFVGREAELDQLQTCFDSALQSKRQLVFVSGEPGIGKTRLIEAFLDSVRGHETVWIGHGQCVEQYGGGEAYLPVLEALGRLCRGPTGVQLLALLRRYAPSWLAQLPAVLETTEREQLQLQILGTTQERMLRELAELLEALTTEAGLIIVLEDLHWADDATLSLLFSLARRRDPARLLLIGSYRSEEVLSREHPLRGIEQELRMHSQCVSLPLLYLSEEAVTNYLSLRLPGAVPLASLGGVIYRRTEGNPLFMVNVVDDCIAQGTVVSVDEGWSLQADVADVEVGVPENLRHMIERRIDWLPHQDQRLLEVASVAGVDFSAASVAAGLDGSVAELEEQCERLVRHGQFLRSLGVAEWPDGTAASRYAFIHALYQSVVYERVGTARRIELHRRIGERIEQGYGEQAGEQATELAVHFERGRESAKAIHYLRQAGETALQRGAHRQAVIHLKRGLTLIKGLDDLSDTTVRTHQELLLQITLGPALMATQGYGAPEVKHAYSRAHDLCRQVGETPQLFPVLYGLEAFYLVSGHIQTARNLGEQLLRLVQDGPDSALRLQAHFLLGDVLFWHGEAALALEHLEHSIGLYDPHRHGSLAVLYNGDDAKVNSLAFAALARWLLGYPDQARAYSESAISFAQEKAAPFSQAYALTLAAIFHLLGREGARAQMRTEEDIVLSSKQGFVFWLAAGQTLHGGAVAEQGQVQAGISQIQEGLAAYRATGAHAAETYLLGLLADAYRKNRQAEDGLTTVAEALSAVESYGEGFYEAELYRLKGELTLQSGVWSPESRVKEAEECFHRAIDIARRQSAKSLELRATLSLSRLWHQHGKTAEAYQTLSTIYGWFTEGFDTPDLQDARILLADLKG